MKYKKTVICRFQMGLLSRIKVASLLWWDIVVTGKMECLDDRTWSEKVADAKKAGINLEE